MSIVLLSSDVKLVCVVFDVCYLLVTKRIYNSVLLYYVCYVCYGQFCQFYDSDSNVVMMMLNSIYVRLLFVCCNDRLDVHVRATRTSYPDSQTNQSMNPSITRLHMNALKATIESITTIATVNNNNISSKSQEMSLQIIVSTFERDLRF